MKDIINKNESGSELPVFLDGAAPEQCKITDPDIASLTARTTEANEVLVRGDIDKYVALIEHADDYTLTAPFGGLPKRGFDNSSENRAALARFFKSGTLRQEVVATYNSGDIAILVTIEWAHAEVGDIPKQDWSLRVTQVFRREETGWQLVHRHADPLVNAINQEQAAALARGEPVVNGELRYQAERF